MEFSSQYWKRISVGRSFKFWNKEARAAIELPAAELPAEARAAVKPPAPAASHQSSYQPLSHQLSYQPQPSSYQPQQPSSYQPLSHQLKPQQPSSHQPKKPSSRQPTSYLPQQPGTTSEVDLWDFAISRDGAFDPIQ